MRFAVRITVVALAISAGATPSPLPPQPAPGALETGPVLNVPPYAGQEEARQLPAEGSALSEAPLTDLRDSHSAGNSAPVPEPATLLLTGFALICLSVTCNRFRKRRQVRPS